MKFIAHRGACLEAQEDTLASLTLGAEYGAYAVECDPRLTKDGVWVLFHDNDLLRLAGDPAKIRELDYADMKARLEKVGKTVTTLDELLENYRGASAVLFDLPMPMEDEAMYRKLASAPFHTIAGIHAPNEAAIASKFFAKEDILAFMREVDRHQPELYTDAGAGNIRLWEHWLPEQPICEVHKRIPEDREIWIMSNDGVTPHPLFCMNGSPAQLEKLEAMGADGVLLNDIAMAKAYQEKKAR